MPHPAMSPHNVAVITGGASGSGFAAAMRFARLGMKVCIADSGADRLAEAATKLASAAPGGGADVMAAPTSAGWTTCRSWKPRCRSGSGAPTS